MYSKQSLLTLQAVPSRPATTQHQAVTALQPVTAQHQAVTANIKSSWTTPNLSSPTQLAAALRVVTQAAATSQSISSPVVSIPASILSAVVKNPSVAQAVLASQLSMTSSDSTSSSQDSTTSTSSDQSSARRSSTSSN